MTTSTAARTPAEAASASAGESVPHAEYRIDPTSKRIRTYLGGELVADSIDASLGYMTGRHPEYLIPVTDVDWERLVVDDRIEEAPLGTYRPIRTAGGQRMIGRRYAAGPSAGSATFEFDMMDAWFEEDEQIWFHPRDPHRRVDVVESSRSIEISVQGRVVARTQRPRLVTETGLPARWYVPRVDVDWSRLEPSATSSGCQYKGLADWWSVDAVDGGTLADVVWAYERPVPEASKLAGLVAFYAEHAEVDTVVDGVLQSKPAIDSAALNPSLNVTNVVYEPGGRTSAAGGDVAFLDEQPDDRGNDSALVGAERIGE